MDFQRVFLFLIFSFSAFILWEGWNKQQNPTIEIVKASSTPVMSALLTTGKEKQQISSSSVSVDQVKAKAESIRVVTDYLSVEISTLGGDITHIDLLKHFDTINRTKHFVLLHNDLEHKYVAQSGLLGQGLPTHNTVFSSQASSYALIEGKDSLQVRLLATDVNGAKVTKVFVFHKSSYLIDVSYEVSNLSNANLETSAYFQLVRDDSEPAGGTMFVPTYTGPAVYTDKDKFQKIDFASIAKNKAGIPGTSDNGWAGMLQHYFVSAWVPTGNSPREFYAKQIDDKSYSIGLILAVATIAPGNTGVVSVPLYVGPAQSNQDNIAVGLGLTVDYGFLTIIAILLFNFSQFWCN